MAVQCQDFGRKDDCSSVDTRAGKSKSLIRWKRLKGGRRRKRGILLTIRLFSKKYLISGDVLNLGSEGSA